MWALPSGTKGKLVEQWRATFVPGEGNPQDALARRLSDVLGEDFVTQSVAVQHRVGPVTVTGRAGLPDAARSRARPPVLLRQRPLCARQGAHPRRPRRV